MARKKKEKIIWIDDGRTIADMSAVSGAKSATSNMPKGYSSGMKEKLRTFFDAMGFMLLPTLAMTGILALAFLIVYFLL